MPSTISTFHICNMTRNRRTSKVRPQIYFISNLLLKITLAGQNVSTYTTCFNTNGVSSSISAPGCVFCVCGTPSCSLCGVRWSDSIFGAWPCLLPWMCSRHRGLCLPPTVRIESGTTAVHQDKTATFLVLLGSWTCSHPTRRRLQVFHSTALSALPTRPVLAQWGMLFSGQPKPSVPCGQICLSEVSFPTTALAGHPASFSLAPPARPILSQLALLHYSSCTRGGASCPTSTPVASGCSKKIWKAKISLCYWQFKLGWERLNWRQQDITSNVPAASLISSIPSSFRQEPK